MSYFFYFLHARVFILYDMMMSFDYASTYQEHWCQLSKIGNLIISILYKHKI